MDTERLNTVYRNLIGAHNALHGLEVLLEGDGHVMVTNHERELERIGFCTKWRNSKPIDLANMVTELSALHAQVTDSVTIIQHNHGQGRAQGRMVRGHCSKLLGCLEVAIGLLELLVDSGVTSYPMAA